MKLRICRHSILQEPLFFIRFFDIANTVFHSLASIIGFPQHHSLLFLIRIYHSLLKFNCCSSHQCHPKWCFCQHNENECFAKSLPLYNIHFMILIESPNREERQIIPQANNEQKDAGMIWLQSALLINAFKPDVRNKTHDFIQEVWSSHVIFLTS